MAALDVGLLSAALAGLISFASPCVLPLALPYLAWIGAISLGNTTDDARAASPSRFTALALTGAFVADFVSMFVALGMAASVVGHWVAAWQQPASVIAGAVLIVPGLHVARGALGGAQESLARGAPLLGVYGLGMGVPFLFGAALTGSFRPLAGHARRHMRQIEWTPAGLAIATGVLIMAGRFWRIGLWMIETFPVFARLG